MTTPKPLPADIEGERSVAMIKSYLAMVVHRSGGDNHFDESLRTLLALVENTPTPFEARVLVDYYIEIPPPTEDGGAYEDALDRGRDKLRALAALESE